MTITLDLWEINLILSALAKLPYEEVSQTIRSIEGQVADE